MKTIQTICYLLTVAACCFGLTDRLTNSDSYSMVVAGSFTALVLMLAPWLRD